MSSEQNSSNNNSTWATLEPIVSVMGKWSWVLILISLIIVALGLIAVLSIVAVYGSFLLGEVIIELLWPILQIALMLYIVIFYVIKVFSKKCGEKDWKFLVEDCFEIGSVRIPKMLLWGIVLFIFADYWGSLLVLIPAILIIAFGPEKVQWKK